MAFGAGLLAASCAFAVENNASPPGASPSPVEITAGPEWVPLPPGLDIEPGSALDFSGMGFTDAPAGKHGRVITRPDGQFAFADSPDQPRRFYGVNLCFGAQYMDKDEADRLAERLVRLGYNALRVHHYERDLASNRADTTILNPAKLDQFDYLMAALIRRGIYLTTDLYVSRSVSYREIGIDRDGRIPMDTFKILVPIHEGAFENWKKFSRNLLDHVNPYTQRRYADEPALAWLCMINEGNFGNFFKELRTIPEWTRAWNRWLARRYPERAALAAAWKEELKDEENPADNTVVLPEALSSRGVRARDSILFLSDTEREMVQRMKDFLRGELGCQALISNANSWTYFATDYSARLLYDYIDDHFYVDHPRFLQQSWRLPSHCPNTSPIADGGTGGRSKGFSRLFDKPFTVTEYNYSGPGRFRGVGGILTGALGALQGWSGLWRFAYSHSREAILDSSRLGYFDLASDPLSQAAERASLCLFLRGDMQAAPHSVALLMSTADLERPADRIPNMHPKWHWMAWVTKVGARVVVSPDQADSYTALLPLGWVTPPSAYPKTPTASLNPYEVDDARLLSLLQNRSILPAEHTVAPARRVFRSETGQITINGPADLMVLDTPRTAGGYAQAGRNIETSQDTVRITVQGSDATVWVSALDAQPIPHSRRLLVTHLTDLQNTGIRYAEPARQTLLDWGRLPHLVRAGQADIRLRLARPEACVVWALAPNGRRLAKVPAKSAGGTLVFQADVAADPPAGARMLYEIAVE